MSNNGLRRVYGKTLIYPERLKAQINQSQKKAGKQYGAEQDVYNFCNELKGFMDDL